MYCTDAVESCVVQGRVSEVFDVFVWSDKGCVVRVCEDQVNELIHCLHKGYILQLGSCCRIVQVGDQKWAVTTPDSTEYTDSSIEALEWLLGHRIDELALLAA